MKGFKYIAIMLAVAAMLWAKAKMEKQNQAQQQALESIDQDSVSPQVQQAAEQKSEE